MMNEQYVKCIKDITCVLKMMSYNVVKVDKNVKLTVVVYKNMTEWSDEEKFDLPHLC